MKYANAIGAWILASLLAGCAVEGIMPRPLDLPQRPTAQSSAQDQDKSGNALNVVRTDIPKPPELEKTQTGKPATPLPPAIEEKAEISLAFEQIPLPGFIQAVYGTILKKNVNLDAKVAERQDLVTLRSGSPQTASQVEYAARLLLKSYGISVVDAGGLIRFVPDSTNLGYLPEIRRGRALPETPLPLRPIFQLVELQAVRNADVAGWMRSLFGGRVKMEEDPTRNAIMLSGNSDDVRAAVETVQLLDQPLMNGRQSARITPQYWSSDELAKKLSDVLQVEGYKVSTGFSGIASPITLLSVSAVNALFCFAGDQKILDHVVAWVKELDTPSNKTGRAFFSYQVQHMDAQRLATTLEKILGGGAAPVSGTAGTGKVVLSRVVVDPGSNTIIYQGNSEDYGQVRSLLETLDKATKEALIEVTVAELTLKDDFQLGVEWLAKEARLDGTKIKFGTLGGLSIGSGGFNYARLDSAGDVRLLLNALASTNNATVLSSPRVVASSGETATIQVGQEVPIITSQQTTPTTGGTGSILQTVQYRTTGVILTVKPVIHSGDQIEIDVTQEVSSAGVTNTGVNTSPTFGTRRVQTKMTLKNGSTVMLGGLISNNKSAGQAGIPLLKDIPVVGQLFRTDTDHADRTELIVIITPYILSNNDDAVAVTEAFKKQLGPWALPKPLPQPKDDEGKPSAAKQ